MIIKLLTLPVLGPIKGVKWLAEKIDEVVQMEKDDKSKIQEELLDLQMRLEMEDISEEEYKKKEKALMRRLDAVEG
jgi:hypothetical protein